MGLLHRLFERLRRDNKLASLTDDFIFPAANVYATANLTGVAVMNNSFVFAASLNIARPTRRLATTRSFQWEPLMRVLA